MKITIKQHVAFERGLDDGAMFFGLDGREKNDPVLMGIRAGYAGNSLKIYRAGYDMAYNHRYMSAWKENLCTLLQYAVHAGDVTPCGWTFYHGHVEAA